MKLLTKNTLVLLIATIIVFLMGSVLFYTQLRKIMDEEAIESLWSKKNEINNYIISHSQIPNVLSTDGEIVFTPIDLPVAERISDTVLYKHSDDENLPFKQLQFNISIDNKNYVCSVRKSMLESEDLIETILISFLILIISITILFIGLNYLFAKKTWKPFFNTLEKINHFEIEKTKNIQLSNSSTKEFQQLNTAISKMTEKISSDYEKLKNFTENASHELQTPLAIIKGKAELLMQSEGLNEEQAKLISEIDHTANRLKKLNQTLLLLSKIENNQFKTNEILDFSASLNTKLEQVEDLILMKNIRLNSQIEKCTVSIHSILADILISNLISNAIRYTPENGEVSIILNENEFIIANNGLPLKSGGELLFERFHKEGESIESTGLGLSLVKEIAVINKHQVNYNYINNQHIFKYIF